MPNLSYIMPCFIVTDLKTSVSFYVDNLGFDIRYMGPDENKTPLQNNSDGLRGFEVEDADGYLLFSDGRIDK
jgi:hypothetical protein